MEKFKIVASEGFTTEEANIAFGETYIPINSIADRFKDLPESQRNKLYGKAATAIDSRVNKDLKELGIEPSDKTHDNVESVLAAYKSKINELTEANSKLKDNTEKAAKEEIEKLTQEISDYKKLNEKLKSDLELVSNEKQTIEEKYSKKELEIIISQAKDLAKRDVPLVDNEDKRELVENDYNKVVFKVGEDKSIYAVDSNGNAIISKIHAGKFADQFEIYNEIVAKREAYKKISGNGGIHLDKSLNTKDPIPNRIDMSSKITLGKK